MQNALAVSTVAADVDVDGPPVAVLDCLFVLGELLGVFLLSEVGIMLH